MASTSSVGSSQAQQLIEERRRLFQPYSSRREKGSGTSKSAKRKNPSRRTWTGQFVCLADRQACRVPSSSEKQILQQAGLGLKKIKFFVDENEEEVVEKLTSDMPGDDGHPIGFPQLKEGKGFEIMSCVTNSLSGCHKIVLVCRRVEVYFYASNKDLSPAYSEELVMQVEGEV